MHYLQGLLDRVSSPMLDAPAPNSEQMEKIFQAALRAPDHGNLKPFRFLVISGEKRDALGNVFVKAQLTKEPDLEEKAVNRIKNMPMRAPRLIALISSPIINSKIPIEEQIHTCACAGQNILHATNAQGFGAIWRTGSLIHNNVIREELGVKEEEKLLGFIYIGTAIKQKSVPKMDSAEFVKYW